MKSRNLFSEPLRVGLAFLTLAFLYGCGEQGGARDEKNANSAPAAAAEKSDQNTDKTRANGDRTDAFAAKMKEGLPPDITIYHVPIRITEGDAEAFSYEFVRGFSLSVTTTLTGATGALTGGPIAHVPEEFSVPMDATLYFVEDFMYPYPVGVRAAEAPIIGGATPAPPEKTE